ncbi:MAG: amidohydrolase [Thermoleophilia bacterium]|jgi:5-methylthioadenosine/S-adenosylhomocysteine deaminase|nr:amidohydrolase [Thermoleophilia bacterium]
MTDNQPTIYRADWVLPVAGPFVAGGAVAVAGERIAAVGAAAEVAAAYPEAKVVDLGRAIVMPGFVNCHSHLEYTLFRGILDDAQFGDWILQLVDFKASLTPEEYALSARLGAAESVASGITTVADTSYGGTSMAPAAEAGLRGRLYLEVFGIDDTRIDETLAAIERRLDEARAAAPPTFDVGLMPHAPYTVSSRLFQTLAAFARERGISMASHVAESKEELTYVRSGSGKFAHDFREKLGWERMLVQPYGVSPIKYLQQWGVFDGDFIAVHCTQATLDDVHILRAKGTPVVHCPKSNAKLGCGIAPLPDLLRLGVTVGLGTDSPAASNIMDMFDEMRTMLLLHRATERDASVLDAETCVRLATLGGAEALGMASEVGSIEPGKLADFIAVDISSSHFAPVENPYSALVFGANQDDVLLTVIGGRPVYREGEHPGLDVELLRAEALVARLRLQERYRQGLVRVGSVESGWWQTGGALEEATA